MDTVPETVRSRIMRQVKGTGNKSTEQVFAKLLREHSIKGWRRNMNIFGRPDFIFPRAKIAIFIDGCFWHGCNRHCRYPASRSVYWHKKIARNQTRDKLVGKELRRRGWRVLRLWEHDLAGGRILTRKIRVLKKWVQPVNAGDS